MPILFLVFFFATVERLVWGQYIYCPAQDWTLDSTITLRCYLPKMDYPSQCTFSFTDQVIFKRQPFSGSVSDRCTVNDVSTTSCTSSSVCGCDPANATYFIVHHTFTVDSDVDGTWRCSVFCFNGPIPQLTYSQDNCEDREVVAHAVLSTPSLTVTTPATGSGWTVRGTVDITQIFSSTGQYSCVWAYKPESGDYTDISSPSISFDSPVSGTSVRTGQCDFPDTPLSSNPGTYTYRVTVSPGQTVKTDSSVIIETPAIPSISCNPSTGYVSEDGEVSCTCNGNVGQPGGRLRWFMESDTGNTPIKDGQYGDATLTVTQTVNRNHHGNKLRCDVDWITDITGPDFTLQVAYPPSLPVIIRTDGQSDPPLEGDTVTFTCSLTSNGNPSARMTWPSEGSNVNTNPLQLTVDKGDNQRTVTCQTSNEFTQHKGIELREDFTLQVYYGPVITLQPADDNNCVMTSDTTSCHVTEGQRVHLLCDVDSNPEPRKCSWSVLSGSDIDLDSRPDLDIVSVNRTDSGMYQVQVETVKLDSRDDRLPLKAHINLIVLVQLTSGDESSKTEAVGVAVGVTLAVVIVIVLVVITWMWRRHWILPCAGTGGGQTREDSRPRQEQSTERPLPVSPVSPVTPVSPVSENYELIEEGLPRHAGSMACIDYGTGGGQTSEDSRQRQEQSRERAGPVSPVSEDYELMEGGPSRQAGEHQPPSVYTSLQTSDIGVPSVYSQISHYSDTATGVPQDPLYENSGAKDRPLYMNTSA